MTPVPIDGMRLHSPTLGAPRPSVPRPFRYGAILGRSAACQPRTATKAAGAAGGRASAPRCRASASTEAAVAAAAAPSSFAFSPPGNLTDLKPNNLAGWSDEISGFMDSSKQNPPEDPRPQFFSQANQALSSNAVTKAINWQAFPKNVKDRTNTPLESWKMADSTRDVQDEYCEWSVTRNAAGKITKVMFTSEGPEYWRYLASVQPDTVLKLYQQHISPNVKKEDLFPGGGRYQPKNKWNRDTSSGAMHLIQRNNTLSAEIELAAAATIVREINGQFLTDQQDLIDCSQYGDPGRFSDPSIGAAVNELARTGADVTLADPVALYIDSFTPVGFKTPDNADATQFFRFTRGAPGFAVRAEFEVPASKNYVVGDITIGAQNSTIQYGAQLVDYIRIRLTGVADNFNKRPQPADHCAPGVGNGAAPSGGGLTTRS